MQLRYLNDVLERLATDAGYEPAGWGAPAITLFRLIAQCADAATAEGDLYALRQLRLRPNSDHRGASVALGSSRVLTIQFNTMTNPTTVEFDLATEDVDQP